MIKGYQSKASDHIPESPAGSRGGGGGGGNFSSVRFVRGKGNRPFFLRNAFSKRVC